LAIVGIYGDIARVSLGDVSSGVYTNISDAGLFAVRYCLDAIINIDRPAGLETNLGDCLVGVGYVIGLG
jgi:hypothetical protein